MGEELRPQDVHPSHDVREEGILISDPVCQICRVPVFDGADLLRVECKGPPTVKQSLTVEPVSNPYKFDAESFAQWIDDGCPEGVSGMAEAARFLLDAWNRRAPDAALIEAGDRLAGFAGHDDGCQIVTHGVWSDPIPCSCGYTEAWKKWKEVRGE